MVVRPKIDSNETGLSFAEEARLGVLPGEQGEAGVAEWFTLEPNEYDDFGGELTLLARNPINRSRQRKKGSITDLDASGGFNQDFTQENMQRIMQGYMFADHRNKRTAPVTAVTATGYTADETGFVAGMRVMASGFGVPGNNGLKTVTGTAAGEIEVAGLAAEAGPLAKARLVTVGRVAGAADIEVDVSGVWPAYTSTVLDFTTLGLIPGEWLFIGGDGAGSRFATEGNNGFKRVRSIAANRLEIDQSMTPMALDAGAGVTLEIYVGRVLKNELGDLIKRRSYNIERQIGAPETTQPLQVQSEYLVGSVASELTMNVEQADKINVDMSFVALDNVQRTATVGLKPGTRTNTPEADAYNTSSDFSALRMAIHTPGNPAPAALFGYVTELTLTINNNLTVNKAVAVLGGFEITAGTFEVSAEATAYFSTVEAVQAVRDNENVQLFGAVAKNNAGFLFDLPLTALGNARLEVEQDEPIMLPLTMDAATAALINPDTDYTLMWVFFDYLPTIAE